MPFKYLRWELVNLGKGGASGKFSKINRHASLGSLNGIVAKVVAMHFGSKLCPTSFVAVPLTPVLS
jgi:hypothetical protein